MQICTLCQQTYPATRDHFPPHKSLAFEARPCRQCRATIYKETQLTKRRESNHNLAKRLALGENSIEITNSYEQARYNEFRAYAFHNQKGFPLCTGWKLKQDIVKEYLAANPNSIYKELIYLRLDIIKYVESQINWIEIKQLKAFETEQVHFWISETTISRVRRKYFYV